MKAISTAYGLRNGYRLSRFLTKCVLEGFFVRYEKSLAEDNVVRFIISRNDGVESGVIYNYDSDGKSYWVFRYATTEGDYIVQTGKTIKFRGVDNNTQDILDSIIKVRKLAKISTFIS